MIDLPTLTCPRCGHGTVPCPRCGQEIPWYPRTANRPSVCPCCHNPYWDRPRRKPKAAMPSRDADAAARGGDLGGGEPAREGNDHV